MQVKGNNGGMILSRDTTKGVRPMSPKSNRSNYDEQS